MSLFDPMPQEPEPSDYAPLPCENCGGVLACHFGCPEYAPPWSALDDEDEEPVPDAAPGEDYDDIDF